VVFPKIEIKPDKCLMWKATMESFVPLSNERSVYRLDNRNPSTVVEREIGALVTD